MGLKEARRDYEGNKGMRESELTILIRELLTAYRVFHYKHWQGPMSVPGISDIIGCYKGRFFAIEIKTDKGKVTDLQSNFLANVEAAGGIAFVARSVEDVIEGLDLPRSAGSQL